MAFLHWLSSLLSVLDALIEAPWHPIDRNRSLFIEGNVQSLSLPHPPQNWRIITVRVWVTFSDLRENVSFKRLPLFFNVYITAVDCFWLAISRVIVDCPSYREQRFRIAIEQRLGGLSKLSIEDPEGGPQGRRLQTRPEFFEYPEKTEMVYEWTMPRMSTIYQTVCCRL